MVLIFLPPFAIFITCVQICLCILFYIFLHYFTMFSLYVTAIATAVMVAGLSYLVFDQIDEEITKRVFYRDNMRELPVYAHRGGGYDAPENTIAAIREAKRNGADGVEIDLSFTKDNIAVLFHDDTVERTTNGFGKLSHKTFDEVKLLDAAANHIYSDKFKGEKVPSFTEAIEECMNLGLKVIIDVKEYDNRAVVLLGDIFSRNKQLYEKAIVASFFPNFIYQLRRVDPQIVTALTYRPKFVSYDHIPNGRPRFKATWKMVLARIGDSALEWLIHKILWYLTGVSAVLVHKDYISAEYVKMWRARGIHVIAWTPNHHVDKKYFYESLNISYITDTMI